MANERVPKPSKAIERYISPTPITNPDVVHGLIKSGLTVDFPIKLRSLNDALAVRRSQFAGLKITLAPAQDDPAPIVEVKRGVRNFVTIDIDADPWEPERSTACLTIDANNIDGMQEWQKHSNIVGLLGSLDPDKKYSLSGVSDISHKVRMRVEDFSGFDIESVNEKWIAAMDYYIHEVGHDPDEYVFRLHLAKGFGTAKFLWIVRSINYKGLASQVENALPLVAEFFRYDPHEDPELFPPKND